MPLKSTAITPASQRCHGVLVVMAGILRLVRRASQTQWERRRLRTRGHAPYDPYRGHAAGDVDADARGMEAPLRGRGAGPDDARRRPPREVTASTSAGRSSTAPRS